MGIMWVIPVRFIPCYVYFTVLWSLYMCKSGFIDAVRAIFTPEKVEFWVFLEDYEKDIQDESKLFIAVVAKMLKKEACLKQAS